VPAMRYKDGPAGPGKRRLKLRPVGVLALVSMAAAYPAVAHASAAKAPVSPNLTAASSSGPSDPVEGAAALSRSGNLLVGETASLVGGPGNWTGYTSGTTVSALSVGGVPALQVQNASLGVAYLASGAVGATGASSGLTYSATVSAEAAGAATATVQGVLVFYNSAGTSVGSSWGQSSPDSGSAWTPATAVTGLAPAGTASVVFYVTLSDVGPGSAQYLSAPSLLAGGGQTAPVVGPLHTSGNEIYDAYGPVVFRGIVITGTEISASNFPSDSEIGHAAAWGANFIRVPLSESLWLNTCSALTPSNVAAYPADVASEVSSITSRHMVALLDLHFNVTARCGVAAQQAMADESYSPTFWNQVSRQFGSNPLVAFDLYNEPHDISDTVWLNGGSATYAGRSFQAAGMAQLYRVVRANAPTNLIFDSGNNWANTPVTDHPLTGTNIVDAIHDYTCPAAAPPACTTPNPTDPSPILDNWATVEKTTPTMVTEFGFPEYGDGTFNANMVKDLQSLGIGWSVFAWAGTTGGQFDLLADTGNDYEPMPSGMPILAGLTSN
jgi:endoglucanase